MNRQRAAGATRGRLLRVGRRKLLGIAAVAVTMAAVWAASSSPAWGALAAGVVATALAGWYVALSRRAARSQPDAGPGESPAAAAGSGAGRRRPRKIAAPRALRAGRALWAGYPTSALPDLERLRDDGSASPAERSRAAFELARWRRHLGEPEDALTLARLSGAAGTGAPWRRACRLLEADLLWDLGRLAESRQLIDAMLADAPGDPHLLLRRANTFVAPGVSGDVDSDRHRLAVVNQVLAAAGFSPLRLADPGAGLRIDNLAAAEGTPPPGSQPLVTVVVPAFNAEMWLATSVGSLLAQTWRNLEVVVVDDASTDGTVAAAEHLAAGDRRVRVLRQPANRGAYAARNRGVLAAAGDLVTVNDADDWSHPQRIEREVAALRDDPGLVGVMTHRSRVTDTLVFIEPTVRSRPERIIPDISSLLLPRRIIEEVGVWDEVRASGDHEFGRRLEARYGAEAVGRIHPGAPASLSLRLPLSLSAEGPTGILSRHHVIGARRLYHQAADHWHGSAAFSDALPYRPDGSRPFPAPRPLTHPDGAGLAAARTDITVIDDLSVGDAEVVEELTAQSRAGLTTALIHNPRYDSRFQDPVAAAVWDAADEQVLLLSRGEAVDTGLLLIRRPHLVRDLVDGFPTVNAARTVVVVGPGDTELGTVAAEIRARFGDDVVWYPDSPAARAFFAATHPDLLGDLDVAAGDWVDIIDLDAWRRPLRPMGAAPLRLGRHSADTEREWPADPDALRAAHPLHRDVAVHILGGTATAAAVLGGSLPGNWTAADGDRRRFLHGLDAYLHYPHQAAAGTLPRTLLEALAAGVPVLADPFLEPLLGPAALYVEPGQVLEAVLDLAGRPARQEALVRAGWDLVRTRHSHAAHVERVTSAAAPPGSAEAAGTER